MQKPFTLAFINCYTSVSHLLLQEIHEPTCPPVVEYAVYLYMNRQKSIFRQVEGEKDFYAQVSD